MPGQPIWTGRVKLAVGLFVVACALVTACPWLPELYGKDIFISYLASGLATSISFSRTADGS